MRVYDGIVKCMTLPLMVMANGNGSALLALSTLESSNVDDDFLSKLKGAYFSGENIDRRKRQHIDENSFDGLFRYHHHVVIPRPEMALIKAWLIEYHDNVDHYNYRRLIASLLKRL